LTESTSTLSKTASILLDDLTQDDSIFYRIEACDLNGQCSLYPSASGAGSFRTLEASPNSGSSGGGGGGGGLEGTISSSHYHGWSEIPVGPLVHEINKDDVPVTKISLTIGEEFTDGFLKVDSYNGKPTGIPVLAMTSYAYFRLSYSGLVGDDYKIEFKVPNEYLDEFDGETVLLFRLEDNSWQEYNTQELRRGPEFTTFSAELPGFSYFAIGLDIPIVEEITNNENTEPTNNNTQEQSEESNQEQSNENFEEGEIISYEEESSFAWWILVVILIAVILSGGAYYVLTKKPEETHIILDEEDPFYKLQVYINKALDHGHSAEEIRSKLLDAGWDDLIIDEEIEKIMSDRV